MLMVGSMAAADQIFFFSDPSGLAAEVVFTRIAPKVLEVRVRNTSTGVPEDFDDSSDQILTGVSWDFGAPGINAGDPQIIDGTVVIGPGSSSIDFDTGSYGPGDDVSGEYGYGNFDGTGLLTNYISVMSAEETTPFGGPNLTGPPELDGPVGGLVANPPIEPLPSMGTIQDQIIATLTLNKAVPNLNFLSSNLVRIEFGSDMAFVTVPEPSALLGLLSMGALGLVICAWRRRRR
jgi:hypothetical protein